MANISSYKNGIGFYVHLHAKNYNSFGTSFKGPKDSYSFASQKRIIMNRVKTKHQGLSKGSRNALEKSLMYFSPSIQKTEMKSVIEELLLMNFGESVMKNIRLNWDTYEAEKFADEGLANFLKQKEKNFINKIKIRSHAQHIHLQTILNRLKKIEECKKEIKNAMTKNELQQKINEMYSLLNQIVKTTTGDLKTDVENGSVIAQRLTINDATPVINILNDVISYYCSGPISTTVSEAFSELCVAAASLMSQTLSFETLEDTLQKIQKEGGQSTHANIYYINNFSKFIRKDLLFGHYYKDGQGNLVSYTESKNKIDITIDWEGQKPNISLKNYNLNNPQTKVHLVSASPFLYMIQNESPQFINHYLNMVVDHPEDPKGTKININYNQAHMAMRLTLVYYALVGNLTGQQVDTFVMRNKINKKIQILSIQELMNIINLNLLETTSVTMQDGQDIAYMSLKNDRAITWSTRLGNVLQEAHRQKISVSLQPSVFSKIM